MAHPVNEKGYRPTYGQTDGWTYRLKDIPLIKLLIVSSQLKLVSVTRLIVKLSLSQPISPPPHLPPETAVVDRGADRGESRPKQKARVKYDISFP